MRRSVPLAFMLALTLTSPPAADASPSQRAVSMHGIVAAGPATGLLGEPRPAPPTRAPRASESILRRWVPGDYNCIAGGVQINAPLLFADKGDTFLLSNGVQSSADGQYYWDSKLIYIRTDELFALYSNDGVNWSLDQALASSLFALRGAGVQALYEYGTGLTHGPVYGYGSC